MYKLVEELEMILGDEVKGQSGESRECWSKVCSSRESLSLLITPGYPKPWQTLTSLMVTNMYVQGVWHFAHMYT